MPQTSSILAIIVLYRKRLEECVAWQGLIAAEAHLPPGGVRFAALVYDNSAEGPAPQGLPSWAAYRAAERNQGLARAYNVALGVAKEYEFDWLLTLDQDTELPSDFLERFAQPLSRVQDRAEVGAVVPHLSERGIPLSPQRVLFARTRALPEDAEGIPPYEIHGFNSGTLWRVSAIEAIGGFLEYFWLDQLDIWVFRQLYKKGYSTYVAGGVSLSHHLSLMDFDNRVSVERYRNFIEAETAVCDLCMGRLERMAWTARLMIRWLRQKGRGTDPRITELTRKQILRLMVVSRQLRLQQWKDSVVALTGIQVANS